MNGLCHLNRIHNSLAFITDQDRNRFLIFEGQRSEVLVRAVRKKRR